VNPLAILFAVLMSVATLFGIIILSTALTFFLSEAFDKFAAAQAATDFSALWARLRFAAQNAHWLADEDLLVENNRLVILGHDPLGNPSYVVGIGPGGKLVFSHRREDARRLLGRDLMALKAWQVLLCERYGYEVFTLVANPGEPAVGVEE
jgi:hypothetical protein